MILLNCVVLLMSVILIHGGEITDECRNQKHNKTYSVNDCMAKLPIKFDDAGVLFQDFNETVIYYNGSEINDKTIDPSINRLFSMLPKYSDCLLLVYDVPADICPLSINRKMEKLIFEQIGEFVNFVQEKNNERIKKLIPDGGLKALFVNRDMHNCYDKIKDISDMKELCSSIDRVYKCTVQVVANHPNKNVLAFVEEYTTKVKQSNAC